MQKIECSSASKIERNTFFYVTIRYVKETPKRSTNTRWLFIEENNQILEIVERY